jgi:hypothetical protein
VTVDRHRRRAATTRAAIGALVGVVLAAGLGAAGYSAIANTTDGQEVGGGAPEVTFPSTPTAAVAVLDDTGGLASLAVVAARPGDGDEPGIGGSVVPVPVSADSSGGFGDERLPLNETVALFGPETLADEIPVLLGVDIDELVVLDEDGVAALLAPLGDLDVDLPAPVEDRLGRELFAAGRQQLTADDAAAVLTAIDPAQRGTDRYPTDVAVWRAISDAVAGGADVSAEVPEGTPVGSTAPGSTEPPAGAGGALGRVLSGPVAVQPLRSTPLVSLDRNPRGVDAVMLDRGEVVAVFGHIAPGKVAAPNPGYNFRVVSRFGDAQLPAGVSRLDVAYTATQALLDEQSNVISVDTAGGEAGQTTVVEVADESLLAAAESLSELFGPVEVRVADPRIARIDVVVTLGTDYLARLDTATAATVAPASSAPATTAPLPESTG